MSLVLRPISQKDAFAFVDTHHRHHVAPRGHLFALAAHADDQMMGVVIVGRPVARLFQDGTTAEVTRLCTLGGAPMGTASKLYNAAKRGAQAIGYRRVITYTLKDEAGTSLIAAGWRCLGPAGGGSWSRLERERTDKFPIVQKTLWEAIAEVTPPEPLERKACLRVAYADPPYIGQARRHYANPEVDHELLIQRLVREFPDGWALSCSSSSLRYLLPLCPSEVRVGAWVKPFHVFKKGVRPAYAWEPLLFMGGRNAHHPPPPKRGKQTTPKDFVSANITLKRGLVGCKPEEFCYWLFELLGLRRGDEFVDLYPGTGAVTQAWWEWQRERAAA